MPVHLDHAVPVQLLERRLVLVEVGITLAQDAEDGRDAPDQIADALDRTGEVDGRHHDAHQRDHPIAPSR
jgi:hypothetical protein